MTETFRDHISTVDEEGKRRWLYPKKPKGSFYNKRTLFSYFQLTVLFGLPFLKINGDPALMLDVVNHRLCLFGLKFGPQDSFLFALLMITTIVFIVLFTSVFGRVWCGWLCPQTIFMEMIFRKLEYLIEGSHLQQKKLNAQSLDKKKILKKGTKHFLFYGISFLISNCFLAYIIGVDALWVIITDPPSEHIVGLVAIIIFTFVFYGVFSWFREQACIMVCPYGRLQSVMQDADTIMVAYDFKRGEPRGHLSKDAKNKEQGDCVDCHQCVDVCPTGIDIRHGTQLECVNCTACIDACDEVMMAIDKPKQLIRYSSANIIENKSKWRLSVRSYGYIGIFVILLGLNFFFFSHRQQYKGVLIRTKGVVAQKVGEDRLSNFYSLKLINRSSKEANFSVKLLSPVDGELSMGLKVVSVQAKEKLNISVIIILQKNKIKKNQKIKIALYESGHEIEVFEAAFQGRSGSQ